MQNSYWLKKKVALISSLNYTITETKNLSRFNSDIVTFDKDIVREIRASILSLEDEVIRAKELE